MRCPVFSDFLMPKKWKYYTLGPFRFGTNEMITLQMRATLEKTKNTCFFTVNFFVVCRGRDWNSATTNSQKIKVTSSD